jgi:PAS domain S-box-containing protein
MWKKLKAQFLQGRGIGIIVIGVTGAVLALQSSGALQLLETAVLDRWFRLRPLESGESRIVIVTIDEADISRLGRWPISDATLAKLLEKIRSQQPKAIGLDLYRNLPVESGHQELLHVFASTPNLIGIQKTLSDANGPAVDPPPILQEHERVAASDLVLDSDGKVRRHLLSLRDGQGKTSLTLGTKLALAYLEAQDIKPEPSGKDGTLIKLGKAKFLPLEENEGGYVRADIGGYQILANFHRLQGGFPKISMTDVLEDRIPANLMRGRIVLIGTVAASLGDRFYTPYTTDFRTAWAGVELHANLASQILSAALDGRQVLRGFPEPLEWLWVFFWSSVGAVLGWRVRPLGWAVVAIPIVIGSLAGSVYLFFFAGWWVVVASPFLALVSAGVASRGYLLWQQLQRSHSRLEDYAKTLELKVQERTWELAEKEVVLRSIYDGVAESIFVVDVLENGIFQYAGLNPTHERLSGIRSTELQGKTPEQVLAPDIAAAIQQRYRACIEAGDTISYEEYLPFQGQHSWWLTSLTPLRNEQERIYRIIGYSIDITERKRAEQALQYSEARYRSVVDHVKEVIFQTDAQGLWTFLNPAWTEIMGFSVAESFGTNFLNYIHPDDRQRNLELFQPLINRQKDYCHHEIRYLTKTGEIRWIEVFARLTLDASNSIIGTSGTLKDITERKTAELALTQQKKLLQTIFDNIPVMLCFYDAQGRLQLVNQVLEDRLGWSFEEIREIDLLAECYPDPEYSASVLEFMLRADGQWQDFKTRNRAGEILETSWANIGLPDGSIVGIGQDITERKRAEEVLQQALLSAEAANQAKSTFLANMSHELRTPLNGILGYAQILQGDKNCTPKQKEGVSVIYQCGTHLLTLINDILDLSKIEAGKVELYPTEIHFPSFITGVTEIFRLKAEQKSIHFTYLPLNQLPAVIHTDEKRLRQVLLNLLSNAIKFTDTGGVTFKVGVIVNGEWGIENEKPITNNKQQTTNNKIRFQIEDTGIGMTSEQLEKIFLPFEQVGDSSRRSEGTGLGLAISQKIVAMMGSKIFVESTPGVGSTFWFDLDMPEVSTPFEPIRVISMDNIIGYKGEKRKILVVDDHWENRAVIIKMLEPIGFELLEASNGQDGLEKALEFQPHLIITDLRMPVMDGFEMTRQLRQLPEFQNTIVIATSASVFEVYQQKSRESGCNDFLSKPIQIEELFNKIENSLNLIWIFDDNTKTRSQELWDKPYYSTQGISTEMAIPPSEELIALYEAVQIGDFEGVEQAAIRFKQLASEYTPFATRILELAQEFDSEKILHLVTLHLSEKAK